MQFRSRGVLCVCGQTQMAVKYITFNIFFKKKKKHTKKKTRPFFYRDEKNISKG